MATENIYIDLDLFLDPAIKDFRKLQEHIALKVKDWNRNPSGFSYQLQIANEFLDRQSAPGLYDSGIPLKDQADEARRIREAEGKEGAAAYEEDGLLEFSEYEAHLKEFGRYFEEDTIKKWFRLKLGQEDAGGEIGIPEKPDYHGAKITSPGGMRQIADNLKIVLGNADANLYDFLGVRTKESRSFIETTALAKEVEIAKVQKKRRHSKCHTMVGTKGSRDIQR